MGKRGPRPKPAEVARRDGTYRADRHGEPVLVGSRLARGEMVDPPAGLTPDQADCWDELLEPMLGNGLVQTSDLVALEMAAVALDQFRAASELVRDRGLLVESVKALTKDGDPVFQTIENPALKIRREAEASFLKHAVGFGLTPSDRVALGIGIVQGATAQTKLEAQIGTSPRRSAPPETE